MLVSKSLKVPAFGNIKLRNYTKKTVQDLPKARTKKIITKGAFEPFASFEHALTTKPHPPTFNKNFGCVFISEWSLWVTCPLSIITYIQINLLIIVAKSVWDC